MLPEFITAYCRYSTETFHHERRRQWRRRGRGPEDGCKDFYLSAASKIFVSVRLVLQKPRDRNLELVKIRLLLVQRHVLRVLHR